MTESLVQLDPAVVVVEVGDDVVAYVPASRELLALSEAAGDLLDRIAVSPDVDRGGVDGELVGTLLDLGVLRTVG